MRVINGHIFYEENDICKMLYILENINNDLRCHILSFISYENYGMDARALRNIVSDPLEYNIDYMYSLDSEVTEEFIQIMEQFGIAQMV